ncbi:hypothetical protein Dimus_028342 [Dionaea muscipula]
MSYVVELEFGHCDRIHASSLASDMGVEFVVVKIGLLRCLFLFENEEDFRLALSLCFGTPLHARCTQTFMAIGKQWGEVLRIEYGSLESGLLEEGRICIMNDVVSPLICSFTLKVDGLEFSCWVAEECAASRMSIQEHVDLHGTPGAELRVSGSSLKVGAAMDDSARKRGHPRPWRVITFRRCVGLEVVQQHDTLRSFDFGIEDGGRRDLKVGLDACGEGGSVDGLWLDACDDRLPTLSAGGGLETMHRRDLALSRVDFEEKGSLMGGSCGLVTGLGGKDDGLSSSGGLGEVGLPGGIPDGPQSGMLDCDVTGHVGGEGDDLFLEAGPVEDDRGTVGAGLDSNGLCGFRGARSGCSSH